MRFKDININKGMAWILIAVISIGFAYLLVKGTIELINL